MIFTALAFVATSVAFLISNGSFYLLSGYHAEPDWAEYWRGLGLYYPYYLTSALAYLAALAVIHVSLAYLCKPPKRPEYREA